MTSRLHFIRNHSLDCRLAWVIESRFTLMDVFTGWPESTNRMNLEMMLSHLGGYRQRTDDRIKHLDESVTQAF